MKTALIWGLIILFAIFLLNNNSDSKNDSQVVTSPSTIPQVKGVSENTPIPISQPLYFNGYPCIEDCSGHEAGYEWAEGKDIDNIEDCGGNSESFIEGCQNYVEENYPEEYNQDSSEDY